MFGTSFKVGYYRKHAVGVNADGTTRYDYYTNIFGAAICYGEGEPPNAIGCIDRDHALYLDGEVQVGYY